MERVIAYIDGFNLYFGLKSKGWQRYYWLNLRKLALNLLKPNQKLILTKYFTARVSRPPDKQKRQANFIEALETLQDFKIFYGKYQLNPRECRKCHFEDFVPNEKMTDVYIAVELLTDAFQDLYDTALLISADSDLTPPLTAMRRLFPGKRAVVAFPPNRTSQELKIVASGYFIIGRRNIAKSLFPLEVQKPNGFVLKCPERWRLEIWENVVISNFYNISPTLTKGGEGGFKDGKREGNVAMALLLKSIKDPARPQWHEVYPERRLSAAECAKKRYHHCLEINFLNNRCK